VGAKILIVEDEMALVVALRDRLHKEGYLVTAATDGTSGLECARNEKFDLVILDWMLPGQSGLTVCQKLRQSGIETPILMLTARRQTMDKVVGLRTGADDYLSKPFHMAELLARVDSLLRRAARSAETSGGHDQYQFGALHIDMRRTEVSRNGEIISLSAKEFRLLRYFVEHPGATLSREELLREVWGYGVRSTRTVDVHVAWLRQKLEIDSKNPQLIVTAVGLGYKFTGQS
jgi:two-component system, OmpR family, alkaline phosphatase synthesis response regulator PhoP